MKFLVAGGAGFIGSHVCRALLSRGHRVVCVDKLSTGSHENIEDLRDTEGFEFLHVDVGSVPVLDVDSILHLASPASPVDYDRLPLETMAANAFGTWRLLEVARDVGASLTFASTSEVYGDPLVHPQPESYWGNVDPVGPRSCYDESKRFAEALLMAARRTYGVRANIVRLFNTYGPRMRPDDGRVIPEMLSAVVAGDALVVHGDGSQTRSFCYVSDLVAGLLHVALDPSIDGEIFNIGNPAETTILQLAETIRRLLRPTALLEFDARRPGDPERRRPIIQKMNERYGWAPTVELEEGLLRTAEWFTARLAVPQRGAA